MAGKESLEGVVRHRPAVSLTDGMADKQIGPLDRQNRQNFLRGGSAPAPPAARRGAQEAMMGSYTGGQIIVRRVGKVRVKGAKTRVQRG